MGLFIVPLVLIELPFILPKMMWENFVDTIEWTFKTIKDGFKF